MRVPDEVLNCVLFVGVTESNPGSATVTNTTLGTAFLVGVPSVVGDRTFVYVVTAKHVIDDANGGNLWLRVNTKCGNSDRHDATFAHWWNHPTDPSIDVAVTTWEVPVSEYDVKTIHVEMLLRKPDLIKRGIGIGDEAFVTGLFTLSEGQNRMMPIVRTGNIAMMPEDRLHTRYGGTDVYLIEARSTGGISGSPVFVHETLSVTASRTQTGEPLQMLGLGPFHLLGLVHGNWEVDQNTLNENRIVPVERGRGINIGISVVVPASAIAETINHPELVQMRDETNAVSQ